MVDLTASCEHLAKRMALQARGIPSVSFFLREGTAVFEIRADDRTMLVSVSEDLVLSKPDLVSRVIDHAWESGRDSKIETFHLEDASDE